MQTNNIVSDLRYHVAFWNSGTSLRKMTQESGENRGYFAPHLFQGQLRKPKEHIVLLAVAAAGHRMKFIQNGLSLSLYIL